jgi:hypothetical protein
MDEDIEILNSYSAMIFSSENPARLLKGSKPERNPEIVLPLSVFVGYPECNCIPSNFCPVQTLINFTL